MAVDFNYSDINWNNWSTRKGNSELFLECLRDCFWFQHVHDFTRYRHHQQPSVLGLIITNEEDIVLGLEFLPHLGASDHKVLTFKFQCYYSYTHTFNTHYNNYKGDYESIRRESNIDWAKELGDNDVNIMLQRFMDRVYKAEEKIFPRSRPFPRKGTIPLCKTTVEAIKRKDR